MPSLLSRLRKRTTSPVSSNSGVSIPPLTRPFMSPDVLPSIPSPTPVERNILADPGSLLTVHKEAAKEAPIGLKPSTRKWSTGPPRWPLVHSTPEANDSDSQGAPSISPHSTSGEAGASSKGFLNRLSELAMPGERSTFGRQRDYTRPGVGDFREQSDANPFDAIETRTIPIHSAAMSHHSSSPSGTYHSLSTPSQNSLVAEDNSPTHSVSSGSKAPKTPDRRRSTRARTGSFFAAPSSHQLGFDSPQTFGHPSPPEARTTGFNFESTPPPPMPALDHPELTNIISSRSKTPADATQCGGSGPASSLGKPPIGTLRPGKMKNTYPRRRYTIGTWTQDDALPFTFGKPSHPQSNLPKAQQIFTSMGDPADQSPTRVSTPHTHSQPSLGSSKNKYERRWSGMECTAGY